MVGSVVYTMEASYPICHLSSPTFSQSPEIGGWLANEHKNNAFLPDDVKQLLGEIDPECADL